MFSQLANTLGMEQSGYLMFFDALGFRFYCLFMITFIFFLLLFRLDFGPMKVAQDRAQKGELSDTKSASSQLFQAPLAYAKAQPSTLVALIPMGLFIILLFVGFWIDGNGLQLWQKLSIWSLEYWRTVLKQSQNSVSLLFYCALCSTVVAYGLSTLRAKVPQKDLMARNTKKPSQQLIAYFYLAVVLVPKNRL